MSALLWLLLLLLTMGGLGTTDSLGELTRALPGQAPSTAPVEGSDEDVERWFLDRTDVRRCGYLDEDHQLPWDVAGGWHCLQAGVGADGAELTVLDVDRDGRPRERYYRTTPDGRLEIVIHTDRGPSDESGRWEVRECEPSDDLQARPCA